MIRAEIGYVFFQPMRQRRLWRSFLFLLLIGALAAVPMVHARAQDGVASGGAELRKKLFVLERTLARGAEKKEPKSLSEIVLGGREFLLTGGIDSAGGGEDGGKGKSKGKEGGKEAAAGAEKKGPGSVSLSLGGGRLTGYSYSTPGLDFTGWSADGDEGAAQGPGGKKEGWERNVVEDAGERKSKVESETTDSGVDKDKGGIGLKLMMRDESLDLDTMEKDGNMRDSFSGANREWFYGMRNYESFADFFKDEEETKDYAVTGVGLEFDLGGYEVGMLNYSRPPKRKSVVFFGNETEGPYRIRATNIIPGSEIVRVDGSELTRGGGYEFSYSKGEITFSSPKGMGQRVVVEYEVAEGGGGEPGKFTGFRIQSAGHGEKSGAAGGGAGAGKIAVDRESGNTNVQSGAPQSDSEEKSRELFRWGPAGIEKLGLTYLTDNVISYGRDGNDVSRSEMEHSLMGLDGAVSLWKNTTLGFEAAKSAGSKSRSVGRYAETEFTIADTKAADLNPLGPYNLDENKLPVMEGSDEVRLNGLLLERDTDYTLDPEYGTLRIKNETLNLSGLDTIEVTYRYAAEEDAMAGPEISRDGLAGLISLDNEFSRGIKHHYALERRSADFMLVGGKAGNQLKQEEQELSWSGGKGLNLSWGRTLGDTLQDYSTGLIRTDEGKRFAAGYKGDAISLSFKKDEKEQYGNRTASTGGADSNKENQSVSVAYKINEKYNLSFDDSRSGGSDTRSGAASTTFSHKQNYKLDAEPIEKLKCSFSAGNGTDENTSAGRSRISDQKNRGVTLEYKPGKKWDFGFDTSRSDAGNNEVSLQEAAAPAVATDTAATGNTDTKWRVQFKPDDKTTFMYRNNFSRQDQVNGRTEKNQRYYDLRRKLGKNADFQYRKSVMDSGRPNQRQNTDVDNYTVKMKKAWFDGTEISLKHNSQKSGAGRLDAATGVDSTTDGSSMSNEIAVNCSPFWKGRKLGLSYSLKNSDQATAGQERQGGESEKKWKAEIEIPFVKESYWALSREESRNSGRRRTGTDRTEISLNGEVYAGASLQVSYSSEKFSDPVNPRSDRTDAVMNVVLKVEREW